MIKTIIMHNLIEIIIFITLLITYYLTNITNNINEKVLLYMSILVEIIFLIVKFIKNESLYIILEILDIIYFIILLLGIYHFDNELIILFAICLLIITIITRKIYNKCLLTNEPYSKYSELAVYILLFMYLYKYSN